MEVQRKMQKSSTLVQFVPSVESWNVPNPISLSVSVHEKRKIRLNSAMLSLSLLASSDSVSSNSIDSTCLFNVDPNDPHVLYPPFYIPPPGFVPRSPNSSISADDEPCRVNGMPPNYRGHFQSLSLEMLHRLTLSRMTRRRELIVNTSMLSPCLSMEYSLDQSIRINSILSRWNLSLFVSVT